MGVLEVDIFPNPLQLSLGWYLLYPKACAQVVGGSRAFVFRGGRKCHLRAVYPKG